MVLVTSLALIVSLPLTTLLALVVSSPWPWRSCQTYLPPWPCQTLVSPWALLVSPIPGPLTWLALTASRRQEGRNQINILWRKLTRKWREFFFIVWFIICNASFYLFLIHLKLILIFSKMWGSDSKRSFLNNFFKIPFWTKMLSFNNSQFVLC